ncbi:thy-1 membrane glycoprotein [Esox lucius]|uniref:Uncharacterized protein n=1 Tax=Esox lucius TaxID=8010 RepID=A0AAY5L855_ESOLU|nr:thy-1 membrane glycoprotein [Esox lucius]
MYILASAICLLGFASTQKVTDLNNCLKDNNLRMDCSYELSTASPIPTCVYTQDSKLVASTNISHVQESTFKDRATVTILNGKNICRLNLMGFADDKPKNFTCTIMQKETVSVSASVERTALVTCSAYSLQSSGLLLTLTSLFFLLEAKWQ